MKRRGHDAMLQRALRRPRPPAGLRAQLRENLRLQRRAERRLPVAWRGLAAGIVLLAGLASVLWQSQPTRQAVPATVAAARQHAWDEAALRETDRAAMAAWVRSVGATLPASARVLMFKDCVVDGVAVKHLRLRLSGGATVDLMVDASGRWRARLPTDRERGWLIAQPRAQLALIAVYTPQHGAEAARAVAALFPGWSPSANSKREV